MPNEYDVIIIGGGPAGLTAGIYAGRSRLKTVLFEAAIPGGQAFTTYHIANYPGFPQDVTGPDLMENMKQQMEKYDVGIKMESVEKLEIVNKEKIIHTPKDKYKAKAVIIATGAKPRKLEVPGEDKLIGRGVSYCATCDGAFFRDKIIGVVGGGDSAIEEAMFLTKFASKVYLIHRRNELRAAKVIQEAVLKNNKIEIIWDSVVSEICGDSSVQGLKLKNTKDGSESLLDVDGVFIYVGIEPNSRVFSNLVSLDEQGYIKTGENMETLIPGLYAAGDVRKKPLRQIVTAASDGAVAAMACNRFIQNIG